MSDTFHPYSQAVAILATHAADPHDPAPSPVQADTDTGDVAVTSSSRSAIFRLLVLMAVVWGLFHGWTLLHPAQTTSGPVTPTASVPVSAVPQPQAQHPAAPAPVPASHSMTIVGLTREPFARATQMAPVLDMGDDGIVGIWPGANGLTNVAWKNISAGTCQSLMQFFATHPAANAATIIHLNAEAGTRVACPTHGRIDAVLMPR